MSRIIRSRAKGALGALTAAILIAAPGLSAQQGGTVTGRISDSQTGLPIGAVQVFIPNLDLGGLTQQNGRYLLQNIPAGTHELNLARIGYRTMAQQVTVGAGQVFEQNFAMVEEALALDEIVVTGTAGGSQVRAIGNVVTRMALPELLVTAPVNTTEDVLSGRIPGVQMIGTPNSAGDGGQLLIRGAASIGLPGDPIVYIDGVRMNSERSNASGGSSDGGAAAGRYSTSSRLNDIDPRDIESIEVIKGPAAATLYGTEAANGVIQIITKKGQAGDAVFDFTIETGQMWMPARSITEGWIPNQDPALGPVCAAVPCASEAELVNTNLVKINRERGFPEWLTKGLIQKYNASVRGGTELMRYSASLSRSDQNGAVDWNFDERTGVRANFQVNASEKFSFQLNGAYNEGKRGPPQGFWGGNFAWGGRLNTIFDNASTGMPHRDRGFQTPPEAYSLKNSMCDPSFDNTGVGIYTGDPAGGDLFCHREVNNTQRSTWSLQMNLEATDWLSHRLTLGIDQITETFEELDTKQGTNFTYFGRDGREGQKDISVVDLPVTTMDFSGTARFRFMDDQLGTATSYGLQYYHTERHRSTARGELFSVVSLSTVSAAATRTGTEFFVENTTVGLYIQEQFDWENRLFLTLAVRGDDNSAFGQNFDAAIYPKVSGSWVVNEEDFWNVDMVDQLRLRGAWGQAGQQPDAFASSRLYAPATGVGAQPTLRPSSFGNADLGPETGEELELGFDASLWEGRVAVEFTYFDRKTKDALVGRTVPPSLWPGRAGDFAGAIQLVNIGEVHTWGTETALSVAALQQQNLRLDFALAYTTLGNKITDMGGVTRIQEGRGRAHNEGYSIAAINDQRIVSADFVNGVNGAVTNILCDPGVGGDGDDRLDFSDNPGIDCADAPKVTWGSSQPTSLVNLTSTLTLFDNWRATANIDGQFGHWMHSDYLGARHTSYPTARAIYLQDNAIFQAYRSITRNGLAFHEGGFVKLREISLSYAFPDDLAARIGADRGSLSFGVRNVGRIWIQQEFVGGERVTDPEMSRPNYDFQGESGGDWPPLSQWTMRLNLTF